MPATMRFASAASRAQCTDAAGARDRGLEALELLGQRRHRARLDRRARLAQRLPVGELGDRLGALAADRRGRLAEVAAQLRVGAASGGRGGGKARSSHRAPPGSRRGGPCARRCAGAAGRRRCASGTSCRPTVQTSARVSSTCRSLSESIAIEVSAFLTANVAAEAAALLRVLELDEVDALARPAAAAAGGRRPAAAAASGRSGGRRRGAGRRRRRPRPPGRRPGTRSARTPARRRARAACATHEADGETTASESVEHAHEALGQRSPSSAVARVGVHLPAAGLGLRERDLDSRGAPAARPPRGPVDGNSVSLKQVTKSATRTGGSPGSAVWVRGRHSIPRGGRGRLCTSRSMTRWGTRSALSSIFAALPLITLFVLLGGFKREGAWIAGLSRSLVALLVSVLVYDVPVGQAAEHGPRGGGVRAVPDHVDRHRTRSGSTT